jgi:hypothetical protein
VTVPVGVPVPEVGETFAMKETLVPAFACVVEMVKVVVVAVFRLNVAVTDCAILIVITQLPVPAQPPPLHPVKTEPAAALADRVTPVPLAKFVLQVPGQVMPAGMLVTVPEPVPAKLTDSAKVTVLKVAVTAWAALIVTVQLPVPVHALLQPAKLEPVAGVSVRVTLVPLAKFALHVPGQVMPAGMLVTVPDPLPATVTDKAKVTVLKVAVTAWAALIVTVQVPVPVQALLQPAKVEPVAGISVKVTLVPLGKFALQVPGQLIPVGALVTVPDPLPITVTDSGKVAVLLKVAVTDWAALIVTVQLPVPVQAPLHPAKVEPVAGVSVRVTLAPLAKLALQVPGQVMPGGVLKTVPLPTRVTVRGNVVAPVQLGKLKLAMRVFQLNTPVVFMYSWVYQKVQSSTGSICMAL